MMRDRRSMTGTGRDCDRRRRGAALAEYGLLLAGLTMACMVAVSVLGGKVGGMIASVATLLPGQTAEDNATVQVGQLLNTTAIDVNGDGLLEQVIDPNAIHEAATNGVGGLGQSMGIQQSEVGHLMQLGGRSVADTPGLGTGNQP